MAFSRKPRSPTHYEHGPDELITAEWPSGGKGERRRRKLPWTTRVFDTWPFLLTCITMIAIIVVITSSLDARPAELSTDGLSGSAPSAPFPILELLLVSLEMWACHLAMMLILHRVRRLRPSDGVKISTRAGVLAYPLYLAYAAAIEALLANGAAPGRMILISKIVIPAVIASLLAPYLLLPWMERHQG